MIMEVCLLEYDEMQRKKMEGAKDAEKFASSIIEVHETTEVENFSANPVNFYHNTRRHIPADKSSYEIC